MRAKADQLLAQWEQNLKKDNNLAQKVDKPTKDGQQWQAMINTVKGISPTSYWQLRGKAILEEAKQKLSIPALPSSQAVATPPPNVETPRSPTSEPYNPPPEIYTSPSEPYNPPPEPYNPPVQRATSPLPPAPRVAR
jgi:hypothetical protein